MDQGKVVLIMIAVMLKTMFRKYSWAHFFSLNKLLLTRQTTSKLVFSEEVALIQ